MFHWKHYKNNVFSKAHLLCVTDSQTPFEGKTQISKVSFWIFPCACWNIYFCSVRWFGMVTKEVPFFKKNAEIVATKMRVFTFGTQIVFAYFSKNVIFANEKNVLVHDHPKTLISGIVFLKFSFPFFWSFLFLLFQHKKDKNKQCTFFFDYPFLTPWQTAKNKSHPYTLLVIFKMPPNTIKLGKTSKQKYWTKFWPNLAPQNPNLGPSFDSTTYLYMCVYSCCEVINWAKFVFLLTSLTGPS